MGARVRAAALLGALAAGTRAVLGLALLPLAAPAPTVEGALATALAAALLLCWLWVLLTSALLAGETLATGGPRWSARIAPRPLRGVVGFVLGVTLTATAAPAMAEEQGQVPAPPVAQVLDGLPLPDRADGAGPPALEPLDAPPVVVVRPGDSLWRIAAGLAPRAGLNRWHALYAANRYLIGPDPDLIRPGTRLAVPRSLEHRSETS